MVSYFEIHFNAQKFCFCASPTKSTLPNCPSPSFLMTQNYSSFKFLVISFRLLLLFFWISKALRIEALLAMASAQEHPNDLMTSFNVAQATLPLSFIRISHLQLSEGSASDDSPQICAFFEGSEMLYCPSAMKKRELRHRSSFLTRSQPCFTFLSLKQSIALSMYSSLSFSKYFELRRVALASFLRMMSGRLLPSAF